MNKTNRNTVVLSIIMCLTLFVKCVLFNWLCFQSVLVSSLFVNPAEFAKFYINKLIPALLLSGLLFVWKRKIWSVVVLFIIDIWIIANLVYYRANGLLLDMSAILMATNLKGFGSSIFAYVKLSYLIFPLLSILYCVAYKQWHDSYQSSFACVLIVVLVSLYHCFAMCWNRYSDYRIQKDAIQFDIEANRKEVIDVYGRTGLRVFIPFHDVALYARPGFSVCPTYSEEYTRSHSILHLFPAIIVYHFNLDKESEAIVSDSEIRGLVSEVSHTPSPSSSLIMVLVESLESWPLENEEISQVACPNMRALVNGQSAYFSKVRSMAKHGVSGDGQMMLVSGMLPINSGAACILYGDNEWPGIPHMYQSSLLIDSANGIWNQHQMTRKYGFQAYDESESGYDDEEVFDHLCAAIDTLLSPYCILAITGSTHSPFKHIVDPGLNLPEGMPQYLHDYLVCLNYTDRCIGKVVDKIRSDSKVSDVTLVITGDHNVFKPSMLHDFQKWEDANKYYIPSDESYCPLIIVSPKIENSIASSELVYQMDLFPTVLGLIDCQDYYWKGFGVDLLQNSQRKFRAISPEDALDLSDRMIRSDFFESFVN